MLHVVETEQHSVRLSYARFRRAPMHRGASGKILAAYLEPAERERLLEAAATPGLARQLDRIRADGFAFTVGELDEGAAAVAAPILDRRGRIAAGLSVAGPGAPDRRRPGAPADGRERGGAADRARAAGAERPRGGLTAPVAARRDRVRGRDRPSDPLQRHDSGILNGARERGDRRARRPGTRARRRRPARIGAPPRTGKHADQGHELGVLRRPGGAEPGRALERRLRPRGDDAGAGRWRAPARCSYTLPITLVITGMLVLLVISYTQVITAHPDGGGAYAVSKANLGRWPAMLAAASLVVDYVLTVAVSLAAGAASLGSVFPGLAHHLLLVSLIGPGAADGGQHVRDQRVGQAADGCPAAIFLLSILAVIVIGLVHPAQRGGDRHQPEPFNATEALGIVLLLKAFAAGCSAVTGIEAIANGVPAFREPRAQDRGADRGLAGGAARRDAGGARRPGPHPPHRPARRRHRPRRS